MMHNRMMRGENKELKKILVLGPCMTGKSSISNFLSELSDGETFGEYKPTKGVRIIEFESNDLNIKDLRVDVDVELWDCSGDLKYRDCWPALKDGMDGVILVANPDENRGDDLLIWYNEFIQKMNISSENVLVILNEKGDKATNNGNISDFKNSANFLGNCQWITDRMGDEMKEEYKNYIAKLADKTMPEMKNGVSGTPYEDNALQDENE